MMPGSEVDLVSQRQAIRRGLARCNTGTVLALLMSIGLALAAAFYAFESHQAKEDTRDQLWQSQRARAMALRLSGKVGRRQESLSAIAQAVSIRASPELRDEAIATLALIDIQPGAFWQSMPFRITTVGFSAGLEYYALGDEAGRVELYRASDRRELARFAFPERAVLSLDFSLDHRYLAARFLQGALRVWDIALGRIAFAADYPLAWHHEHSIRFHPGEPWLLVSSAQGPLRIIDMRSWVEALPIPVAGGVAALQFNRGGTHLAIAVENRIEIWDFAGRRRLQTVEMVNSMTDLAWHPNEQLFAAAHNDGNITLVDRRFGKGQTLRGHTMLVTRVMFNPSGQVLVSTSWDGTSRFWDAGSGQPLLTALAGYAYAFDAPGERVFFTKERQGLGDWQFTPASGFDRLAVPVGMSDRVLGIDVSADGEWLAGTTGEGVHLWHRQSREPVAFVPLPGMQRAAFQTDGQSLVASTSAGLYRIPLTLASGTNPSVMAQPELLPETKGRAFWLGFKTQGQGNWFTAATRSEVAVLKLRESAPARLLTSAGPRRSAAISPDGCFVATSAWKGGGTRIWDLTESRQSAELPDEGGLVQFSPDGRCLAVGASTEFLFYDTATWQATRRLKRDVSSALSGIVAFSPDGRYVALTHTVRQVRLLAPDLGEVLASLDAPQPERITALCFSRDGNHLAAATDNRVVHLWDIKHLRQELAALGLDWESRPATRQHQSDLISARGIETSPAAASPSMATLPRIRPYGGAGWFSGLGAGLALLFAMYSMRHHRRLVDAYEALELVAEERRCEVQTTQAHLVHSQKMKALGTLAAGMAHDFNNLLSIIRMSGQLVRRQYKPTGLAQKNLDAIERAVTQGKRIVGSILGYARRPTQPDQPCRVALLVSDTLAMLNTQYLGGLVLTLELDSKAPPVRSDQSRLEQILLNLIVNAYEAMNGSGNLTIAVRLHPRAPKCVLPPRGAASYIELTVQDSGPGIDPGILPRIFEPFFTTKTGRGEHGTGLGLTTVYAIARQDGLGLAVESEVNHGATFRVFVPVDEAEFKPD